MRTVIVNIYMRSVRRTVVESCCDLRPFLRSWLPVPGWKDPKNQQWKSICVINGDLKVIVPVYALGHGNMEIFH